MIHSIIAAARLLYRLIGMIGSPAAPGTADNAVYHAAVPAAG